MQTGREFYCEQTESVLENGEELLEKWKSAIE